MSARRPARRYIGFRFSPLGASRKDVQSALDAAWRKAAAPQGASPPRLLVCERGLAIAVVPAPLAGQARLAMSAAPTRPGVRMTPVVTSGTILTVKERLALAPRAKGRA